VNAQPSLVTRPFYYTTLAADPTNADVVYAGAEDFFRAPTAAAPSRASSRRTATTTTCGSTRATGA
jgi:hypothetical protein